MNSIQQRAKAITRRSLLVLGMAVIGGQAPPVIAVPDDALGDVLDTGDFITPGFVADFRTLPRFASGRVHPGPARPLTDPGFKWVAGYVHAGASPGLPPYVPLGKPFPAFSWLSSELATYPNADAIDAGGYTPFSVADGVLTITADKPPASIQPLIPAGYARDYISGAMSSYPFSQTYGYFEMEARVPAGKGLWPAFWLLPVDLKWPPEIDVMEILGDKPDTLYTTLHSRRFDHGTMHGYPTKGAGLATGFHRYGVDWGPEHVRFYLDRRLVCSQPTPADWHAPFYLLVNLAVGGPHSWPGPPDSNTPFPARFDISAIRAWQRRAYL